MTQIDIKSLESIPLSLMELKNPPTKLFYKGAALDTLLKAEHKIAIVGTRKPNPYTRSYVAKLASKIAQLQGVVVSGGAIGVDIIAHTHAFPRTIMFSPSSLDIYYPRSNKAMIEKMMQECAVISEYENSYIPHKFSFLERNRLVIALSDVVIIPQADRQSGSMQSARIACELKKPIFVLPHRLGESDGTQELLATNRAKCIYDMNAFLEGIFGVKIQRGDEILEFCMKNPSFEMAYLKFGEKIYEYELEGKIVRESGSIRVV